MLFPVKRVKAIEKEQEVCYDGVLSLFKLLPPEADGVREGGEGEQEEVSYIGVQELFEEPKGRLSEFPLRVRRILRVGRINNVNIDPYMFGRISGSSTNKYIKFCADSGTPAAFIPRSVAERNKL